MLPQTCLILTFVSFEMLTSNGNISNVELRGLDIYFQGKKCPCSYSYRLSRLMWACMCVCICLCVLAFARVRVYVRVCGCAFVQVYPCSFRVEMSHNVHFKHFCLNIYIWLWLIIKVNVKVMHISTVNISQTLTDRTRQNRKSHVTFRFAYLHWPWIGR